MPTQHLKNQTFTGSPGKDQAALVIGTQEPDSIVEDCHIHANGADWGLKMSGNLRSTFNRCQFEGGTERAIDIVQGNGISFVSCDCTAGPYDRKPITSRFNWRKQTDAGIKGGAQHVLFEDCTLTDVLVGDFSIYNHDGMGAKTNVTLRNCRGPNGAPVIARVLWGSLHLENTPVSILHVPDLLVRAYFWFCRKFGDKREPAVGSLIPAVT